MKSCVIFNKTKVSVDFSNFIKKNSNMLAKLLNSVGYESLNLFINASINEDSIQMHEINPYDQFWEAHRKKCRIPKHHSNAELLQDLESE